jgi:ORF6N domain
VCGVLVQSVKRNLVRFPADFMFQLLTEEWEPLSSLKRLQLSRPRQPAPHALTEQGVGMLSSVLGSQRAIAVNIEIMRTFVRVPALAATHGDLAKRLAEFDEKTEALATNHDTFTHNTQDEVTPEEAMASSG